MGEIDSLVVHRDSGSSHTAMEALTLSALVVADNKQSSVAGDFARSFAHTLLQSPLDGVAQIIDGKAGGKLEKAVHVLESWTSLSNHHPFDYRITYTSPGRETAEGDLSLADKARKRSQTASSSLFFAQNSAAAARKSFKFFASASSMAKLVCVGSSTWSR